VLRSSAVRPEWFEAGHAVSMQSQVKKKQARNGNHPAERAAPSKLRAKGKLARKMLASKLRAKGRAGARLGCRLGEDLGRLCGMPGVAFLLLPL